MYKFSIRTKICIFHVVDIHLKSLNNQIKVGNELYYFGHQFHHRVSLFNFCVFRWLCGFCVLHWICICLFMWFAYVLCIILLNNLYWVLNNFWSRLYLLVFDFLFFILITRIELSLMVYFVCRLIMIVGVTLGINETKIKQNKVIWAMVGVWPGIWNSSADF